MTDPFAMPPVAPRRADRHAIVEITTESGSAYELDETCHRIRRLTGTHEPTSRQGTDGEWSEFITTTPPVRGQRLAIGWSLAEDGHTLQGTMTSTIETLDARMGCYLTAPSLVRGGPVGD